MRPTDYRYTGCYFRSSLFWDVSQRGVRVRDQGFGTTYRSLDGRTEGCPEKSVTNYHSHCVTSQKSEDLIHTSAEARNDVKDIAVFRSDM
jgi:hypothetical protein